MDGEQDSASTAGQAPDEHAAGLISSWLAALGERFQTGAELALAETRLAITSFMLMIFLAVLAAGALLFAWALIVFAAGQWAVSAGYPPVATALVLGLVHVLLAWVLWTAANVLGRTMDFPETRRLLSSTSDTHEDTAT